jgi:PIN domain nuclease of toxin-antitoxin system
MLRFLLDTNALIRRVAEPRKLSREQTRILDDLEEHNRAFAISAITLYELGLLPPPGVRRIKGGVDPIFRALNDNPLCHILPITVEIAGELAAMGDGLRDPADRAIVATARIHNLKLLTSDQRIIDSRLVPVIE